MATNVKYPQHSALIFANRHAGFGDVSCALKIADQLVKSALFAPESIFLTCNHLSTLKELNRDYAVLEWESEADKFPLEWLIERTRDFALQILVPGDQFSALIANGVPTLLLYEYNVPVTCQLNLPWVQVKGLGIPYSKREDLIGLLQDEELLASHTLSNEEKAKRYSSLRPEIHELLRADHFDDLPPLFFGYVYHPKSAEIYILTVLSHIQKTPMNSKVLFLLPSKKSLFSLFENPSDELLAELKELGVRSYEIVTENEWIEVSVDSENSLDLRLVSTFLERTEMKTFWMISEKKSVVTGDQSLGEAASTKKEIIYEVLAHKKELGESLAEHFGPEIVFTPPDRPSFAGDYLAGYERILGHKLSEHLNGLIERVLSHRPQFSTLLGRESLLFSKEAFPLEHASFISINQLNQLLGDGSFWKQPTNTRFSLQPLSHQVLCLTRRESEGDESPKNGECGDKEQSAI